MTQTLLRPVADFQKQLAASVSISDTTALLNNALDADGVQLTNNRLYGFTIDTGSKKEYIVALLSNDNELSQIVSISRQGQATSGFTKNHQVGASVMITDWALVSRIANMLNGTTDWDSGTPLKYDGTPAQTNPLALATVQFVLDTASGSSVIAFNPQTIDGQATNVDAGDWVYFDEATGLWEKTDASNASKSVNVKIGKARGTVSSSSPAGISGGIFISGTETVETYTAGQKYYLSDTPGELSTTPGTNAVEVGIGDENGDLLVFATKKQVSWTEYAVDSVGTDAYAITVPDIFAYQAGQTFKFKAGTANTGACTLNVNGLGAKTIKKNVSDDLATGDILQNQIVIVIYDGTNMRMINPRIIDGSQVVNYPIPSFQQDIPTNVTTLALSKNFYFGSTIDGSAIFTILVSGSSARIYRFERDEITGQYLQTHSVDPTFQPPNDDLGSIIVIGIYIYVFSNNGTNITVTRFLASNLTGEQAMTVPTLTGSGNVIAWTDGVDAYVVSGASPTVSNRWSVSGTTFSAVGTASISAPSYFNNFSTMWDGTNAFIVFSNTNGTFTIDKLTNINGSTKTTTTKTVDKTISDITAGGIIIPIDNTRVYIGFVYTNWNELNADAVIGSNIRLYPISKP